MSSRVVEARIWRDVRVLVIVPLYEIRADIDHMGIGFPGVFFMPVSDPFDQEFMVSRVIVIGSGCNDDLGGPSFSVGVDLDRWGCSIGVAAVWL
jgi:hypothetical protein